MLFAKTQHAKAAVFLTITTFLWASNAIVGHIAIDYIAPFSLSFFRWLVALLILLPFTWRLLLSQRNLLKQNFVLICFTSLLGISAFNTLQYLALHTTSTINIGVINAIMPAAVLLLTWLIGQEKVSRRQLAGIFLCTLGVLTVVSRGEINRLQMLQFNLGDLLMLSAVLGFAVYTVLLRRLPTTLKPLTLLTVQILLGTIGILPLLLWDIAHNQLPQQWLEPSLIITYVAIFPSLLAYFCWNSAVAIAGANLAALSINLLPLFTSFLAFLILNERLQIFHALAMLLIFTGIFLSVFVRPQKA